MASVKLTELRLTPVAVKDLTDIWIFKADKWSLAQADRYIDGLHDTFQALLEMSKIARERAEFTPPVRIHPSGQHVVIYRISREMLEVVRVLDGQQNWQAILKIGQ